MGSAKSPPAFDAAPADRARALFDRVTVGIVTALPKELAAAKAMLDDPVEYAAPGDGAGRDYVLGEIPAKGGGSHAVALVCTGMGNNLAAVRVTQLLEQRPQIHSVLMVGIAGGVPCPEKPAEHVRLGDVVVVDRRGVVQYDLDKKTVRRKESRHAPRPPSPRLLEGVNALEALAYEGQSPWNKLMDRGRRLVGAKRPPQADDVLRDACDPAKIVHHPADAQRKRGRPRVFHGAIASGNTLLKNPIARDRLRDEFGVKAVEMEGSGLADAAWQHEVGYLVVRGVCDYCDEQKGDAWQMSAAIVAAAYARAVLERVRASELPDREERRRDEPRDEFFRRVLRVCRMREEARERTFEVALEDVALPLREIAEISYVEPFGPLVTYSLAATAGEVDAELIDLVQAEVAARGRMVSTTLVYGGTLASETLVRYGGVRGVRLTSFIEYQGLIDFRRYLGWQTGKLKADPTYPHPLYVDQRAELVAGTRTALVDRALDALVDELCVPYGRFVLILGDFGAGKTFLLHELGLRMAENGGALVPVLIEMRALEKARTLDALIAQHLALAGVDRIDLRAFRYMLSEGRIALLFDGFDELALRVSYDRAAEHFDTLLEAAGGSAKVVVTSRTQHFFSDQQVRTALAERAAAVQGHRVFKLQRFTEAQIRCFLGNKLASEAAAEARFKLLDSVKDLLGLSANPRMLGFITEIDEVDLRAAEAREGAISSAGLYQLLLNKWLVHEFDRAHPRGISLGLSVEQRWKAASELAMLLWQRTERTIKLPELPRAIVDAIKVLAKHEIDAGTLTHQVGSGTLLVRDDEDNFSFIHQSVMEWLVAKAAAEELRQGEPAALAIREMSDLMADFFAALAGQDKAIGWARQVLGGSSAEIAKSNALRVLKRLGVEAEERLNLAGQDLRGQDLSGRNLRGADLTGADLREAILVDADLTGASLANARLQRADLSRAMLVRANLEGADLSSARLLGADLRAAKLARVRLRYAQLPGARLDDGALAKLDTFGSAPSQPSHADALTDAAASSCNSVAVSPDGALLASAHSDGSVRLWDIASGAERHILRGHSSVVWSVVFSPDGAMLASGADDKFVRLWEVESGAERRVLTGHSGYVRSVAFSPDGRTLASGAADRTIRLWDVESGAERHVLEGHSSAVWSVTFSPDGATLASGAADQTLRLWETSSGTERSTLTNLSFAVWNVAFSPDGLTLASATDKSIQLWNSQDGTRRHALEGHSADIRGLAFSPDGVTLASGAVDNTIRLWDVESGALFWVLRGHSGPVWSVAFSPDGATLASGAEDMAVRLWDVANASERRVLKPRSAAALSVTFSPDGAALAFGAEDTTVRLWDIGRGAELHVLGGHSAAVLSVAFSSDGVTMASGAYDRTIRLWDEKTGTEPRTLKGHLAPVWSVAFSPDGTWLISGSMDKSVRVWDVKTGTEHCVLKGHSNSVFSVAFSPDLLTFASGAADNTVRLWNLTSQSTRHRLRAHLATVRAVTFSSDGATLASGADDKTICLWDAARGVRLHMFQDHTAAVWSVSFSPNGQWLASGAVDKTVRIRHIASGDVLHVLRGHRAPVRSVAFSPDGASLASASEDGTIRLWNIASGTCLAVLVSRAEGWAAFTPDGRYKLSGDIAGSFWFAIGLCRFAPGELDPYVPSIKRIPDDEPLFNLPPA
jgi:WD40 repeat protein/nucleoside phosphorylase